MMQAQTGTKCTHHWIIESITESADGKTSRGTCARCGLKAVFVNDFNGRPVGR